MVFDRDELATAPRIVAATERERWFVRLRGGVALLATRASFRTAELGAIAYDRAVLLLLYGEGWSVAEIAGKTGWSGSKVKVRAHRARKKLRRLLEEGVDS